MLRGYLHLWRFPAETAMLAALLFFLPLFEAPKNLAWLGYVLLWLANRIRSRDFGGRWDLWDTLILAWIGSAYLVAAFAGLSHSEWGGATDVLRYGLVLWLVKRSGYGPRELRMILGVLLFSAVAGLPHAYWRLLVTHAREYLELNSVGQVNHTAIYLAIVLGMTQSAVMAYWRNWPRTARLLGLLALAVLGVSLLVTASRAAVGVGAVLTIVLAALWLPRLKAALAWVAVIAAIAGAFAWTAKIEVVRKQETQAQRENVLAFRDRIWRSAAAAWERYPVFGVGMDNYNQISLARIETWRREAGKPYEESAYMGSAHGHSLLFNTLAERGLVGLGALAAVLIAWIVSLARNRPRAGDEDLKWALWGAALSAWFVSVGAGLANTTLHHEHAILSVTLLGAWLAWLRGRSAA